MEESDVAQHKDDILVVSLISHSPRLTYYLEWE
jgi:hypothetical protein